MPAPCPSQLRGHFSVPSQPLLLSHSEGQEGILCPEQELQQKGPILTDRQTNVTEHSHPWIQGCSCLSSSFDSGGKEYVAGTRVWYWQAGRKQKEHRDRIRGPGAQVDETIA